MPDCESVNARNAPIAKSGISKWLYPLNIMIKTPVAIARKTMPLVKTSRSPKPVNWRGRNPSRAKIADRRGKSCKAGVGCYSQDEQWWKSGSAHRLVHYRANCRASAERMVSCGPAITPRNWVNPMLPTNKMPIRIAITIRVRPAFLDSGRWKAGTPLLMASMPVRAVHPVAEGV